MKKRLFLFCIQLYLCTPLFTQINRYKTYTPLEYHDYSLKVDFTSILSKLLEQEKEGRAFQMLEEISVRPSVSYLVKVRNKDLEKAKA